MSVALKLFTEKDISQVPVMKGSEIVGSLNDSYVFSKLVANPNVKEEKVGSIMQSSFPVVELNTTLGVLSGYINRENSAVLVKDKSGRFFIVTQYDVIQAISR